ncbi:Rieske (2Fe-2S) protein [Ekhidna sp.]|uniref:Rieske (2Fe-2S) protein n=1 Tax=Ekhidna sp. TaxID=2608089 RepID=UPI003B50C498
MRIKLFESEDKAKEVLEDSHPRLIIASDKEICIVRCGEELFAFQNACAHMGESLHKGNTNFLMEIVCPLHTYRFNMKTGEEAENRCSALKTYSIHRATDGIFIEM